jgi:hypothetical protein
MRKIYMKKAILTVTVMAFAAAGILPARAGDREWGVAGRVLTGVFTAGVVARALTPGPVYYAQPATVVVAQPQVVYVQAPPVVATTSVAMVPTSVQAAPVCSTVAAVPTVVQPQVVYLAPRPVYYAPPPLLSLDFGFGRPFYHHFHRR